VFIPLKIRTLSLHVHRIVIKVEEINIGVLSSRPYSHSYSCPNNVLYCKRNSQIVYCIQLHIFVVSIALEIIKGEDSSLVSLLSFSKLTFFNYMGQLFCGMFLTVLGKSFTDVMFPEHSVMAHSVDSLC
jgi:hypothetical protein